MTKPAVYKVKLASGVTRHIVAWDFDHVAAMRFESAPDASLPPSFDVIRGIEWVMDCDAVLFRDEDLPKPAPQETAPAPSAKCERCGRWLYRDRGEFLPCNACNPLPEDPFIRAALDRQMLRGTATETLPSEAKPTWSVGDFCPMACGTKLRASLGQLMCGMGHQVGATGLAHAHGQGEDAPWCHACRIERTSRTGA